jgi:3-mercaptopyruvate sulfurtransferase SseA
VELTFKVVEAFLLKLGHHFPECNHTPKIRAGLAVDYFDDFKSAGIRTAEEAKQSVDLARSRARFFPKSAEIIDAYQELKAKGRIQGAVQIEQTSTWHDPTPEEIALNKKRIAICADSIAKKISWEEAEEQLKNLK